MKKYLKIALFSSCISFGFAAPQQSVGTYSVVFGYGTFNLTLNATSPITKLQFTYGNPDYQLQSWGPINSSNATMTQINLGNGVYQYTIIPSTQGTNFGTNATFSQTPLLPSSVPSKNMPFNQYYGLFQNIQVDGLPVSYIDQCQGAACNNPAPNKLLGAYYADWTEYPGHGNYTFNQIPYQNLNTIYYAFGSIDPTTGDAEMFDPYADVQMSGVNAVPNISLMRQQYPYLNLIYSYGGWGSIFDGNYQSGDMSVLFTYYPQNIAKFASSMVSAMLNTGFNGIDIDYEWAGPFESDSTRLGGHQPLCIPDPNNSQYSITAPLSQAEADGYAELIYDLRQDIKQLPNAQQYLLTVALFSGVDKIDELAGFNYQGSISSLKGQSDLKIVLDNVSYADLMTYDFHGAFDASPANKPNPDSISNFQSMFQESPDDPTKNPAMKKYDVLDAVQALEQADPNDPAFTAHKIVVGVPAYARIVQLAAQPAKPTSDQLVGIYDPLAPSVQQAVMSSNVSGEFVGDDLNQYASGKGANLIGSALFDYKCILQYPNDATSPYCYFGAASGSHPIPSDMILYAMNALPPLTSPGGYAATPWGYGAASRTFMSFDNNLSAANKAHYVLANNLGGAMIWEIDGDISPTDTTNYTSKSLVYSLCSVFHGSACTVPN